HINTLLEEEQMIIIMERTASEKEITAIFAKIEKSGLKPRLMEGKVQTIIGLIGDTTKTTENTWKACEGVADVIRIQHSYKLTSRDFHPENTVVDVNGVKIGDGSLTVMA